MAAMTYRESPARARARKKKGASCIDHFRDTGHLTRTLHVPIVPMSIKAPVAPSTLYIETLFEPEFVT